MIPPQANFIMTHYDLLMDIIKDHLNSYYNSGRQDDGWDEAEALESAYMILQAVEEYQSLPKVQRWRATD